MLVSKLLAVYFSDSNVETKDELEVVLIPLRKVLQIPQMMIYIYIYNYICFQQSQLHDRSVPVCRVILSHFDGQTNRNVKNKKQKMSMEISVLVLRKIRKSKWKSHCC